MSAHEVNCGYGDYQFCDGSPSCEDHPYEIIEIRCYLRPTDSIMHVRHEWRGTTSPGYQVETFGIDDDADSPWSQGFDALRMLKKAMEKNLTHYETMNDEQIAAAHEN